MTSPGKELIEAAEEKLADLQREQSFLKKMTDQYGDDFKKVWQNRWRQVYSIGTKGNELADQMQIFHSCGCCQDAVTYFMPFHEVDGYRVFGEQFTVGQGSLYEYGVQEEYDGWDDKMKEAGVPDSLIESGRKYFEENAPGKWDDD